MILSCAERGCFGVGSLDPGDGAGSGIAIVG
jgi:hypothetical protein